MQVPFSRPVIKVLLSYNEKVRRVIYRMGNMNAIFKVFRKIHTYTLRIRVHHKTSGYVSSLQWKITYELQVKLK